MYTPSLGGYSLLLGDDDPLPEGWSQDYIVGNVRIFNWTIQLFSFHRNTNNSVASLSGKFQIKRYRMVV